MMLPSFPLSLLQLRGSLPSACGGVSFYSRGSSENTNSGAAVPAQLCVRGSGADRGPHAFFHPLPASRELPSHSDCVHACVCARYGLGGFTHPFPAASRSPSILIIPDVLASLCAPPPFPCFYNQKAAFSLPPSYALRTLVPPFSLSPVHSFVSLTVYMGSLTRPRL